MAKMKSTIASIERDNLKAAGIEVIRIYAALTRRLMPDERELRAFFMEMLPDVIEIYGMEWLMEMSQTDVDHAELDRLERKLHSPFHCGTMMQ